MKDEFNLLKKTFKKNNWKFEESEKLFKCISVKNKDGMYLYNYNNNNLIERNHHVLIKCRGLVINKNGNIINYPFDRFFNSFEKECCEINWDSAEIQEKLDGSLICVFWSGKNWEVTTRGSFYPNEHTLNFSELFKKRFDSFTKLNKNICYIFELITKHNRIIKWYKTEGVYLIGARNIDSLKELSQKELDLIAKDLNVSRPLKYKANNLSQCKKLFDDFNDDDEGLVVVDNEFNRIKIKQDSYIKLSRIKMLKEQDIFNYVLGKTQIDVEYLNKLPEVAETIKNVRTHWNKTKKKIINIFNKHKNKSTRKDFAIAVSKYPFKSILFSMLDNKNIDDLTLKWELIKNLK
ncbi:MAG: hypothetical protein ACTSUT_12590 [Promethearchaeota archaeon]